MTSRHPWTPPHGVADVGQTPRGIRTLNPGILTPRRSGRPGDPGWGRGSPWIVPPAGLTDGSRPARALSGKASDAFGTLNQARYGPRYRMVDRSRRPPLGPLSGTSEGMMPATSGVSGRDRAGEKGEARPGRVRSVSCKLSCKRSIGRATQSFSEGNSPYFTTVLGTPPGT